jgi:hypothetical protein
LRLAQVFLLIAFGGLKASAAWPTKLFAPYVDFTAWPPYDIVGEDTNTGLHYLTLAFIVADTSQNATTASPANIPAWGGYTAYSVASSYRLSDINTFRASGGDVVISFGGASGTELAGYVTDTNRLRAAYQFVINTYSATRVDFDIEGAAVADPVSVNRRSAVLASLQAAATAAGKSLQISLTLPVLPTGLDNDGLYVLQSAVSNGVDIASVNVMAMDYGDNAAPNPSGKMGAYAIMAATNLFSQLKSVYQTAHIAKTDGELRQMVGVTPMLGVNDVTDEIFDQAAATQLVAYASSQNLGMLGFWSLNRDVKGGSSITQTTNQFTGIFLPYGRGATPTPVISAANAGVLLPTNSVTNLLFPVTLSAASTGTVSVAYFTSDGSAAANKNFYLNLTKAVGANLFVAQATGTITNNNSSGSGSGTGVSAITTQWLVTFSGSAFTAVLTLSNSNSTNITINSLAFNAPYTSVSWIACDTNLTDWVIPALNGTRFTISGGWNPAAVIPGHGSLNLTFFASPGSSSSISPTNVVINGIALGSSSNNLPGSLLFKSVSQSGKNIVLSWQTTSGYTNLVQVSTNFVNWSNVSAPMFMSGSGNLITNWTDIGAATNGDVRFYRVMLQN